MKNWERPIVEEVNISETAHNWTGIYKDGGYIGDGIISGHLSWDKPTDEPAKKPSEGTTTDSTEMLS